MKQFLFIVSMLLIISCGDNKKKSVPVAKDDTSFLACETKELPAELVAKRPRKPAPPTSPDVPAKLPTGIIYFDFDGEDVVGTNWNYMPTLHLDSSGLSQQQIDSVVMMAMKKFDILNVLITTDRNLYNNTLAASKQMIVFTRSNEWYGMQAAGTTFVKSFGSPIPQPGFVFTKLMNYNTHKIWKVACHETGHTLGCYHQAIYDDLCKYIGDYRPLVMMGNVHSTADPIWTVGANPFGCTQIQNDIQLMASLVGFKS